MPGTPQPEQTGCLRRSATLTITARSPNSTSLTHAPGSPSIRLNAVVTRTSPSSSLLTFEQPAACRRRGGGGSPNKCATCETLTPAGKRQRRSGAGRRASSGSPTAKSPCRPRAFAGDSAACPGLRLRYIATSAGRAGTALTAAPRAGKPSTSPPNDEESRLNTYAGLLPDQSDTCVRAVPGGMSG